MTSRFSKLMFSNTNFKIGQNGTGSEIWKVQKRIAYYLMNKMKKKNFVHENGKWNFSSL
jgi:hypothetical protein